MDRTTISGNFYYAGRSGPAVKAGDGSTALGFQKKPINNRHNVGL
jgi:hypothetical protein